MTKRIISILILITMLLTACSDTSKTEIDATVEPKTEIYDLPDESVPVQNGTPATIDQTETNSEPASGETQNITDVGGTETEESIIDESVSSNDEPTQMTQAPSETHEEPLSSEANEPSESQNPVREVDPAQLAALTLFALSMEYPDFVPQGFYATNSGSKGIYAMFESGGESLTAHIYPIEKERTELGTMDIYANEVGFAAFELIEGADDHYEEIPEDAYAAFLSSLSGVSVFTH